MSVMGLDLGGTKLSGAIFNQDGEILHQDMQHLDGRAGPAVGEMMVDLIEDLLSDSPEPVSAIGVSVPGIYYAKTGKVWAPNIPDWVEYPLLAELERALAKNAVAITIDSDRACYILGETWQGVAKGCKNAIFMAVGTGIGAGILIEGRVLRGAFDIAGATGWLALSKPFRAEYIECGCYEYHASGSGLAKVTRDILKESAGYTGALRKIQPEHITARDVFSAVDHEDPIALRVIDQAIEYWGMATANYVSLFNPEMIIFGGGVFGPASRFIDRIHAEAKRWAQPISMKQVKFESSSLGNDAGLMGAGFLAIRSQQEEVKIV
jgi:glucokinase